MLRLGLAVLISSVVAFVACEQHASPGPAPATDGGLPPPDAGAPSLDDAALQIARAYCDGMIPCCQSSVERDACATRIQPSVKAELDDRARWPMTQYTLDYVASCADEVRARAARCLTHDTGYVFGVTRVHRMQFCQDLIRFGYQSCSADSDCGPTWACDGPTNTRFGTQPARCFARELYGYPCDVDTNCPSGRCTIDTCENGIDAGPPYFTGYVVSADTCAAL
jgi:hypothetical protein